MWQKAEDGHADGHELLLGDVLVLILYPFEAACFDFAVEDRSPTIA
jgi:hypothetical protein